MIRPTPMWDGVRCRDWLTAGTSRSLSVSPSRSARERRMVAKRILLVEDEEEIADILALVLRSEGYVVDTAATVAQARGHLRSLRYALVNSDLRLPDGDGLEIVDRAAELGSRTSILSGYVFQLSPEAGDGQRQLSSGRR